jgi:hypothetical protein
MTNIDSGVGLLLAAAVVAVVLGLILTGGRWRRRRSSSGLSYLGTVSEHWLDVHRAEH